MSEHHHQNHFDAATLAAASAVQQRALDPRRSVWIAASAGTGKTEVLTRRLLRLLLADVSLAPQQILALTFTRAGASEMQARLPAWLAKLAALPDTELVPRLSHDLAMVATATDAARVRELVSLVRQQPPLVATLHSLAQQLVARDPVAAGLPLHFELLEDHAQQALLLDVQHDLLVQARGQVAEALNVLLDERGEHGWRELTGFLQTNWGKVDALLAQPGLLQRLQTGLQLDTFVSEAAALPTAEELAVVRDAVAVAPEHLARLVLQENGEVNLAGWEEFLLTDKGKGKVRASVLNAAQKKKLGVAAAELMQAAAERWFAFRQGEQRQRVYVATAALVVWAHAVRQEYTAAKHRAGLVDYDDLMQGLVRLLRDETRYGASWLSTMLDRRFKHLVLDEGQDNNQAQARVVEWLVRQILSGDVGEAWPRTVLAVGDTKQSVFRFQGAVPQLFLELQEFMQELAGAQFTSLSLAHNFRSGPQVLAAVNEVFQRPELAAAVMGEAEVAWPQHVAVAAARPSRVELWPVVTAPAKPATAPWALPTERYAQSRGRAQDVAGAQLAQWLLQQYSAGVVLPSTGQPLRWCDVLIVVQRNKVARALAQALRGVGIPVAQSEGAVATVVHDAVALLRVIYAPADTLALGQVLKGWRRWDEAQLLALARAAAGETTWVAALPKVDEATATWLDAWCARRWEAPLALVDRMMRDLGGTLADWQALLDLAAATPALVDLLARVEQDPGVLRRTAAASEGVRLMTVHKSKGLEAPLVILPDTLTPLDSLQREKILWGEDVLVTRASADLSPLHAQLVAAEKTRLRQDSLRTLYVAMTRARDWLVVSGFKDSYKPNQANPNTWWELVRQGVSAAWREEGETWVRGDTFAVAPRTAAAPTLAPPAVTLPDWWQAPLPAVPAAPAQSAEQARGEMIHAALQGVLPLAQLPPDAQQEVQLVQTRLPWLFGPGSRAEVSVGLADGTVGRLDRLVPHEGAWWIIDFKTGTPSSPLPAAYAAQLQRYVAAVRGDFPADATLRAAVVWTATAQLEELV